VLVRLPKEKHENDLDLLGVDLLEAINVIFLLVVVQLYVLWLAKLYSHPLLSLTQTT
jgi:hypothetical protein